MLATRPAPPRALPGFEHMRSFWEPKWECYATKVQPGEFCISKEKVVLTTVLGSCISACIYDPKLRVGGMNHFMLPAGMHANDGGRSMRYGLFAMEQLINGLLRLGSRRENLQVKLTGGGDMMGGVTNIGQQNIEFIEDYVAAEQLQVLATDFGGDQARKVAYFPQEGRLLVNRMDHRDDQRLIEEERSYRQDVDSHLDDSDVELF